jgi:hypothetical protein
MNNLKTFIIETGTSPSKIGAWIGKSRQLVYYLSILADDIDNDIMKNIHINYIKYAKEGLKYSEKELHKLKSNIRGKQ